MDNSQKPLIIILTGCNNFYQQGGDYCSYYNTIAEKICIKANLNHISCFDLLALAKESDTDLGSMLCNSSIHTAQRKHLIQLVLEKLEEAIEPVPANPQQKHYLVSNFFKAPADLSLWQNMVDSSKFDTAIVSLHLDLATYKQDCYAAWSEMVVKMHDWIGYSNANYYKFFRTLEKRYQVVKGPLVGVTNDWAYFQYCSAEQIDPLVLGVQQLLQLKETNNILKEPQEANESDQEEENDDNNEKQIELLKKLTKIIEKQDSTIGEMKKQQTLMNKKLEFNMEEIQQIVVIQKCEIIKAYRINVIFIAVFLILFMLFLSCLHFSGYPTEGYIAPLSKKANNLDNISDL